MPIGMRRRAYRLHHGTTAAVPFDQQVLALSPLAFWYAGDGTSIPAQMNGATDGGAVTTWDDLSTGGYEPTQGTAGKRPTYHQNVVAANNRSTVQFASANSQILSQTVSASIISGQIPLGFYIVFITSTAAAGAMYGEGKSDSATPLIQATSYPAAGQIRINWRDDAGTILRIDAGTNAQDGNIHMYSLHREAAAKWNLRLDGLVIGEATDNISTTTINRLALGAFLSSSEAVYFNGQLCAVIAVNANTFLPAPLLGEHYNISTYRGTWTKLTSLPTATEQHGMVAFGGKVYVIGGATTTAEIDTVQVYDIATDTWGTITALPVPLQSPVARVVNGKIYVIGGATHTGSFHTVDTVYCYDPASPGDGWVSKTVMPTDREDMGGAVLGSKVYVFGGCDQPAFSVYKHMEVYDADTDTWDATKADMPDFKVFGDFGAEGSNGKVYAIGATNTAAGYANLTPVTAVYEYDPDTDTWDTVTAIPASTCYKEVARVGDWLYVIGGATTNIAVPSWYVYAYNVTTDTWVRYWDTPYKARGIGMAEYGSSIYVGGGHDGTNSLTAFYRFDP